MAWLVAADPLPVGVKPDAIDWLTAIGTVGAVFVAVGVAVVERLRAAKARHEGDELAASQRLAERRATARLVSRADIRSCRTSPASTRRTSLELRYPLEPAAVGSPAQAARSAGG